MSCWAFFLPFFLCGMDAFAASDDPEAAARNIIGEFAAHLFVMEETETATEFNWYEAEADAVDRLSALAESRPQALSQVYAGGVTPLMLAAYHGHAHLVEVLLKDEDVKAGIETVSLHGFSAADIAILAYKQSEPSCRFRRQSPLPPDFTPSLVTQSYYQSRNPYPRITKLFARQGVHANMNRVNLLMQRYCPEITLESDTPRGVQAALLEASRGSFEKPKLAFRSPETLLYRQLLLRMWEQRRIPFDKMAACLLDLRRLKRFRPELRCHP